MRRGSQPFPEVDLQLDLPALERRVLEFCEREAVFSASVEGRPAGEDGSKELVFYDGPPLTKGMHAATTPRVGLYLGGGVPPQILSRLQERDLPDGVCY